MSRTPAEIDTAAPGAGQHTYSILEKLRYNPLKSQNCARMVLSEKPTFGRETVSFINVSLPDEMINFFAYCFIYFFGIRKTHLDLECIYIFNDLIFLLTVF